MEPSSHVQHRKLVVCEVYGLLTSLVLTFSLMSKGLFFRCKRLWIFSSGSEFQRSDHLTSASRLKVKKNKTKQATKQQQTNKKSPQTIEVGSSGKDLMEIISRFMRNHRLRGHRERINEQSLFN